MRPTDATIETLLAKQQERPLPSVIPREVMLPNVSGKANVLIGMRRSGKTYRLFHEMRSLADRGIERSRMLFLNLEDARLGDPDLSTLDRALEIFYRRTP